MQTGEDAREAYGEQRLKSLYWLGGRLQVLVSGDRESGLNQSHVYGDKHETQTYFKSQNEQTSSSYR